MYRNHPNGSPSTSTSPSTPPRSSTPELEMPGRASTTTSLYSDDPTEVPTLPTTYGVREGRLIDYDEPHVEHQEEEEKMINPTDKLRDLLNQMRKEVEISRPVNSLAYSEDEEEDRPKRQRDDAVASNNAVLSSPPRKRYGEESEDEEQSPPTPPPRIGNPYAARRGERRNSSNLPSSQPGRLPSRAAVLRNSTSRSPPSPEPIQPQPKVKSPPTRLEAFLASSTSSIHPIAESSTSGQLQTNLMRKDSGSSTSSSRKGKDRAISPILSLPQETQSTSLRRNRVRQTPPPEAVESHRRLQTPRRISVDLAPEDMSSFARNAVDLEVRGEVELDLDEGLSALGWEESSQSVIEDSVDISQSQRRDHEDNLGRSTSRLPDRRDRNRTVQPRSGPDSPIQSRQGVNVHSTIGRSQTRHSSISPENNHQSDSQPRYLSSSPPVGNALRRSQNQNRFSDGQTQPVESPPRTSRHISARHGDSSPSPPLPALPEPDLSAQSENSEIDTYSSRRAALFRSTSRSASGSTSTSTARSGSQTPSQSFGTATGLRSRLSQRSSVERSEEVSEGDILPKRSPAKWKRSSLQTETPESIHGRTSPVPLTQQSSNLPSPVRKEYTPPRGVEDIPIPVQDPIQVNIALAPPSLSTPSKFANPNFSTLPTPKPPGAWQPISKPKVRFSPSPLSQHSPVRPDTPSRDESVEGVSIHRLRVSPRRSPKTKTVSQEQEQEQEVGNESFLGRLNGSLSSPLTKAKIQIPIPPKSNTFTLSTTSLQHAKSTTIAAEQNLLITQKQWLEALSAINTAANTSSTVVRKGWGWSTWVLWGLVEVLILWSVFRVTMDYATSLTHISTLDPFHPLSLPFRQSTTSTSTSTWSNGPFGSISLELPIPSALQTLVGGNGGYGNVNFFDLMESWGIWSIFISTPVAGGGGRMLAGGVGGVPS